MLRPLTVIFAIFLISGIPAPPVPEDHRDVYIYHGRRSSDLIALTYDDGPHPDRTPALMALLRELDCPATFFVLGEAAERNPRTTRALVESEFEVGNHSMSHANFRRLDREEIEQEVDGLEALLTEAGGSGSRLFRAPYGLSNRAVVEEVCGERGMEIIHWSLDTEDWNRDVTADDVIETILGNAKGGDIILMHDIHSRAVPATRAIVPALRERGLRFVTVAELLEDLRTHVEEEEPEPTVVSTPASVD